MSNSTSRITKPPGSIFKNRGRWMWKVRLPGENKRRSHKLCPPGQSVSLPTSRPEKEAWRLAWRIWERHTAAETGDTLTVRKLAELYLDHCRNDRYFDKVTGQPTREYRNCETALRKLELIDKTLSADAIALEHLRNIRDDMIEEKYVRTTINKYISQIQRMYRWAAGEGHVPGFVASEVAGFPTLEKDRTRAKEVQPIEPADEVSILAVLGVLPKVLRDMASVQWICDMRPGEVCIMRRADIDMSDEEVWIYEPTDHKLRRRGKHRYIPIFPEAQKILKPYFKRKETSFIFCPREATKQRNAVKRSNRQTPVQPSQVDRSKADPQKRPGERYNTVTYGRAILYAVNAVNANRKAKEQPPITMWSPNQLRHAAATENRALVSREIAAIILGHAKGSNATDVYSWRAAKEEAKRKAKEELRTAAKEVIRAKGEG